MERDSFVMLEGDSIPAPLREMHRPPRALHVRGALPDPDRPRIAIVGSRNPSDAGEWAAYTLARDLARAGVVVVSGFARGIDTAAHRGALDAGGITVAFVGHGLDRVYPRASAGFAAAIARTGALASEYGPGIEPKSWTFVARNRLIAGYARGTVVVEAGAKSGALITAGFSAELGLEVLAVPGDPRRPGNRGSNRLLRDGAGCVLDAEDVLLALGLDGSARGAALGDGVPRGLAAPEAAVWRYLRAHGPASADAAGRATALAPPTLQEALFRLELAGLVHRTAEGFAVGKRRGAAF